LTDYLDIEAIKRLKARYFRLLDLKQWDEFETLFTDDFTFFSVHAKCAEPEFPVATSAREFRNRLVALTDGCSTTHHGHMPEIEVNGNSASGVWAMQDVVEHPTELGMRFTGSGHYYDYYERGVDKIWRIAKSKLVRIRLDPLPLPEADKIADLRRVLPKDTK
jgi:hypothetical protein